MNEDIQTGVLIGIGGMLTLGIVGLFVARANWPSIRGYLAHSIDVQAMGQLSAPANILWTQPASALIQTITGKSLPQIIHETLSLTVADGIGDAILIRPAP